MAHQNETRHKAAREWKAYINILVICLICVATIVAYGSYRCSTTEFSDPLTIAFAQPPWDKFLDGWALTHFCFYTTLACLYPQLPHLAYTWVLGAAWEATESIFKEHPFYLSKCSYRMESAQGGGWWYGRWQDLVMNALGLGFGRLLWAHAQRGLQPLHRALPKDASRRTTVALRSAIGSCSAHALASSNQHSSR